MSPEPTVASQMCTWGPQTTLLQCKDPHWVPPAAGCCRLPPQVPLAPGLLPAANVAHLCTGASFPAVNHIQAVAVTQGRPALAACVRANEKTLAGGILMGPFQLGCQLGFKYKCPAPGPVPFLHCTADHRHSNPVAQLRPTTPACASLPPDLRRGRDGDGPPRHFASAVRG